MHQFALQTAFHIWVYLLMGLPAFIDYISPYSYNAPAYIVNYTKIYLETLLFSKKVVLICD